MVCRRFPVRRCCSSFRSKARDSTHHGARRAAAVGRGVLHGPRDAADGPRRAREHRARSPRRHDRGDGLHGRGVSRLFVCRRDRRQAGARQSPRAARARGDGRAPRGDRARAGRRRPRRAVRAPRRRPRRPRRQRAGPRAAPGARGAAARGTDSRRVRHAHRGVKRRRLGLSTRAIHGEPKAPPEWTPVAPPLYQSSTFTNPVGSSAEVLYTRYGNNPNQVDIGRRLALLEGADAALFVASGMGAAALAHLAVLRPGDHLLSSEWIYGGVHRLFAQEFGRLGIDVTFVNPTQSRDWKRAMKKTTRAIFVETPTNPLLRVIDPEPLATLCKTEGLVLLVDSTFATPINFRPLEHGA